MKNSTGRYILLITLCAIGGGLSAVMSGLVGIFRGAVLGGFLAAAFPAIDYLKSKGKCQSVWTSAFVGAIFGLLAGLIICQIKSTMYSEGIIPLLNQPLLLIAVSVIYGFLIHLSLAVKISIYGKFQLYMIAIFLCHYCRFAFSDGDFLQALIFALIGFLPFAVLWGMPVAFLLTAKKSASIDKISNKPGKNAS